MRKIQLIAALLLVFVVAAHAQKQCWEINPETNGIEMLLSDETIPYSDHIEMSGEMVSFVTRWNIDGDRNFSQERSLVFPMLRTIPNNTHGSLRKKYEKESFPAILANGVAEPELAVSFTPAASKT